MKPIDEFSNYLKSSLKKKLPQHELKDVIEYSAFPAGKMIRAQMILALGSDLKVAKNKLYALASFIELHHTYTLIHDDLPAMDNDDIRRGRPSAHKKYNEWKAILSGDSLMNVSFQYLNELNNPEIFKLALWATGPKGLIGGQYIDLNSKPKTFSELIRLHELKTSRLFVFSVLSIAILSQEKDLKTYFRLGNYWGLIFQLKDDLVDKDHPHFKAETQLKINELNQRIVSIFSKIKCKNLEELFKLKN